MPDLITKTVDEELHRIEEEKERFKEKFMYSSHYVGRPIGREFYRCYFCNHDLPFKNRADIDFIYCPYCSKKIKNDDYVDTKCRRINNE